MGTTVERDLKTLRTSKLMSSAEFKTMMVVLEKYHKEKTSAKKRKENRELDLRPFLYDDGDTYEKPFYNILLKMLYEVASFRSDEKQHEDLLKVFKWFKINQKLFNGESHHDKNDEMVGSNFKPKEIQVPKLYLRPKSADGNFPRSSKETSEVLCDRETNSRSELGAYEDEKISKSKHYNPLDRLSVSLKVLPLNIRHTKDEYTSSEQRESNGYAKSTKRNASSFIPIQNVGNNPTISLPSTFVLKPFNHTAPPTSTPVSSSRISPVMSPHLISPSLSPRSSPILRSSSSVYLNLSEQGTSNSVEKKRAWGPDQRSKVECCSSKDSNVGSKIHFQQPKSQRRQEHEDLNVDGIKMKDISNANLVMDEEGVLFHNQVKQRLKQETQAKRMEIIENLRADNEILEEERGSLESQLIQEHERYLNDRLNYEEGEKRQRINVENGIDQKDTDNASWRDVPVPLVNTYDLSRHRPLSAITFRDQGLRVESVLDMVQPVGHQMKYEKEKRNRQHDTCIWDKESVSCDQLPVYRSRRIRSAYHVNFADDTSHTKTMDNSPLLKSTESVFNPEWSANDYSVHFPHQSNQEAAVKDFKVSGTVSPDTIRYQWTDDGFGSKTYLKKRTPKETATGKSSRNISSAKHDVALTTGERGLDKRTVASLMIIRHLGTAHRRERDYPKFSLDECMDSILSMDEKSDDEPKQNVEYLPFWKHVPPKKGLTILNIPENLEPPLLQCENTGKTGSPGSNESQNCLKDMVNSTPSPQQVVHEMFSCLTPKRRPLILGKKVDKTLSVNARSISPSIRLPTASSKLSQASQSRPSSARRVPSPSPACDHEHRATFSVKNFSHFCFDDNYELLDDYMRQRVIWAAVSIQRIFRGHMARQYTLSLRQAERERQRKAAVALQSTFRGYLARKKLMKESMADYKPSVRDLQWARDYKGNLKEKEVMRNKRNQGTLRKQNRLLEKQQEQMMGVAASDRIHEIFNPPKPSKAVMRASAITIQRYFRGWYVRKYLRTVKEKALKRTFSFNKFIKSYQDLVSRIQKRYNIEIPNTALQFHELQEYVDRLYKYEIAFGKIAENGVLKYEDILKYFAECGHHPYEKEVDDAIALVTKDTLQGRNLTKAEAVEVVFQIYIPKGTGLSLADVRKSTWTNPLINGEDVTKRLSKKDLKFTNLDKCLSLIADSQGDRSEVKDLLRPPSPSMMKIVEETKEKENPEKSLSRKQRSRPSSAKAPGGGNFILARAQYHPVKPNGNKQGKRRPAKVRK